MSQKLLQILIGTIAVLLWLWLGWNVGNGEPEIRHQQSDLFIGGFANPIMREFEVLAVVTQYNPVEAQCDSTPDITASGKKVKEGFIACPIWLDFGDLVEIEGDVYQCEDRMAKKYRKQWRFDILSFDLREAVEFGVQEKKVKIY